jgi:hypothetical protein
MPNFNRVRRNQVNSSPNQFAGAPGTGRAHLLVGYHISNYQNSTDSFVGFYDSTSGTVTVGTTAVDYGKLMIPQNGQVVDRSGTITNPLFSFNNGISVAAVTTEPDSGTTNPTNQLTIEIFYYT